MNYYQNLSNRDDTDAYQLVTWSKDQSLRIWKIESGLQETVGQEFDEEEEEDEEELEGVSEEGGFPGLEDAKERSATTDSERKTSEYDIIEVEELRSIEEKERREKEKKEDQEGKDDRRPSLKEGLYGTLISFSKSSSMSFSGDEATL